MKYVEATIVLKDSKGVTHKTPLTFGKSKGGMPTVTPAKETSTVKAISRLYLK